MARSLRCVVIPALLGGCSSTDRAAKLADQPDSAEGRIAATTLLAQGDLPEDFHLVKPITNVPPDGLDPDACRGVRTVRDQFGQPQSTLGNRLRLRDEVRRRDRFPVLLIWADSITVERRELPMPIAQACWPARVEANLRRGLPPSGVEIVSVTSERIDLPAGDDSIALGTRVTANMREAGIDLPVYFDFLYLAHDRIAARLELRRQIEPPVGDRARQALEDATAAAPVDRPRALALLSYVNERAGLQRMGHQQRLATARLAPDEQTRHALAGELAECKR